MAYRYDGKYYHDSEEITEQEYTAGIAQIRAANALTLRIRAGEEVDVPDELRNLVDEQLAAWEEIDKEPEGDLYDAEALSIITGEVTE